MHKICTYTMYKKIDLFFNYGWINGSFFQEVSWDSSMQYNIGINK